MPQQQIHTAPDSDEKATLVNFRFPTIDDVNAVFGRFRSADKVDGWRVRLRKRFGYFKPIVWYQTTVDQLAQEGVEWIDVGGGKTLFPNNPNLSIELSRRAAFLVGVDPSNTLEQNELVHEKAYAILEDYKTDRTFDLATMRMVAEHVEDPDSFCGALGRLIHQSGHVVILTPNKWAFVSIIASIVPNRFHPFFARILSPNRLEEDVFPTFYRMNTRSDLKHVFDRCGFDEVGFAYLADCVVLQRFRVTYFVELLIWKTMSLIGIRYPETNILAIYRRR